MASDFVPFGLTVCGLSELCNFGGGKVSSLMGDFAKGIKSFKKNMAEEDDASMEATANKPGGTIAGPGTTQASTAQRQESSATR